jgi:hypothetical protein
MNTLNKSVFPVTLCLVRQCACSTVLNLGLRRTRSALSAMMQLSTLVTLTFLDITHNTQTYIMSLKRISTFAVRAAIASSRPIRFQASALLQSTPKLQSTIRRPATCLVHQRYHSTEGKPDNKVYNFDSIKQLTESPDPSRVLIGTLPLPPPLLPTTNTLSRTRCPRTRRIRLRLHPHRHQHTRRLSPGRPLHARPRIRG